MENLKNLSKFWKGKRVFITGHTGFKGSWLSILLNMLGANIYGYSLKPEKNSLFLKAKCKKFLKKNIYSDINNRSKLEKVIIKSKPHIIFHLAAQPLVSQSFIEPLKTFNTNIIGTSNVLESLKEDGQTWEKTATQNVYQSIDQSKLVPLLVKTIQELEARIAALEQV